MRNEDENKTEIHIGVAVDTGIVGEGFVRANSVWLVAIIVPVVVKLFMDAGKLGFTFGLLRLGFLRIRFARLS